MVRRSDRALRMMASDEKSQGEYCRDDGRHKCLELTTSRSVTINKDRGKVIATIGKQEGCGNYSPGLVTGLNGRENTEYDCYAGTRPNKRRKQMTLQLPALGACKSCSSVSTRRDWLVDRKTSPRIPQPSDQSVGNLPTSSPTKWFLFRYSFRLITND